MHQRRDGNGMTMKFFSREAMYGEVPEAQTDALIQRYYAEHLPSIASLLPPAFVELAHHVAASGESLSIHDGQLRRIALDPVAARLVLGLRAGDLSAGYYDLELEYTGVDIGLLDREQLRRIADDSTVELVYHEADLVYREENLEGGQRAIHRILFWPHDELEIVFRGFAWHRTPASQRAVVDDGPRYLEMTSLAG
jgi:hypothetical protein